MAQIIPFKAVRPAKDKVSLVTSRPFEEYSPAELACQLQFNPFSFLHILNPAYANQQLLDAERRYRLVARKYMEFREEDILCDDDRPAFYIHRIISEGVVYTGIVGGLSVEEYKSDVIKKHEDTLRYRVELFKDYMKFTGFNTEPVLVTYAGNDDFNNWITEATSGPAEFEFSTKKREMHLLWTVTDSVMIERLQKSFSSIDKLYIADGHHRSASAEVLYDELGGHTGAPTDHFMAYLIAEDNIRISEFNRLVRSLNGLTRETFIRAVSHNFVVELKGPQQFRPHEKHHFGMYLDQEYYLLRLRDERMTFTSPIDSLDCQILFTNILLPILGITDLRDDDSIVYVSGKCAIEELAQRVDSGEFSVAFVMFPSNIEEVKAIADANLVMPPKSTYIEPKLRSGLIIHELL